MSASVQIHLIENAALCVTTVGLFALDHPVAGSVALAALICNTCFVTFSPRPKGGGA